MFGSDEEVDESPQLDSDEDLSDEERHTDEVHNNILSPFKKKRHFNLLFLFMKRYHFRSSRQ